MIKKGDKVVITEKQYGLESIHGLEGTIIGVLEDGALDYDAEPRRVLLVKIVNPNNPEDYQVFFAYEESVMLSGDPFERVKW